MADEDFLTVTDVAELLQLNPQTVRNWLDGGKLPAVRAGRRVRVRRTDLEAFIGVPTTVEQPEQPKKRASTPKSKPAAPAVDPEIVAGLRDLAAGRNGARRTARAATVERSAGSRSRPGPVRPHEVAHFSRLKDSRTLMGLARCDTQRPTRRACRNKNCP